MNEIAPGSPKVVPFPKAPEARADAATASLIEVLQEHLALAREGKLRSIAVVSVSADGSAIGTQWSCAPGDIAILIGKLAVLTHDLMSARKYHGDGSVGAADF
jgi:hypothetical protein